MLFHVLHVSNSKVMTLHYISRWCHVPLILMRLCQQPVTLTALNHILVHSVMAHVTCYVILKASII